MNMKTVLFLALALVILGVPATFAYPQYLDSLNEMYANGSCDICHESGSKDGPRTHYGTLFENQPDHATNASAALRAIGAPPIPTLITTTPETTKTLTQTPEVTTVTETPIPTTVTGTATPTPVPPEVTATPSTPGFGILLSLVGLFAWSLLAKRNNK